jgi:WD40 repeat protein
MGSQDYDLFLWDVETGQQAAALEVQNTTPPSTGELGTAIGSFYDRRRSGICQRRRLATLGGDNTALVWEPMLAGQPLVLSGHTAGVNAVAWSPDFTRLATASEDGTARVWDAGNGQELLQLTGHSGAVNQVAWSPDGSLIATAGDDGTVWLWDGMNGEKRLRSRSPLWWEQRCQRPDRVFPGLVAGWGPACQRERGWLYPPMGGGQRGEYPDLEGA